MSSRAIGVVTSFWRTRSRRVNVAFRAPSGRPKGKANLERSLVFVFDPSIGAISHLKFVTWFSRNCLKRSLISLNRSFSSIVMVEMLLSGLRETIELVVSWVRERERISCWLTVFLRRVKHKEHNWNEAVEDRSWILVQLDRADRWDNIDVLNSSAPHTESNILNNQIFVECSMHSIVYLRWRTSVLDSASPTKNRFNFVSSAERRRTWSCWIDRWLTREQYGSLSRKSSVAVCKVLKRSLWSNLHGSLWMYSSKPSFFERSASVRTAHRSSFGRIFCVPSWSFCPAPAAPWEDLFVAVTGGVGLWDWPVARYKAWTQLCLSFSSFVAKVTTSPSRTALKKYLASCMTSPTIVDLSRSSAVRSGLPLSGSA